LRRSEELREVIEERIATGVYAPGIRLDESELAEEFGVSRTPVREALIQLASGGLIDLRPRRGAVVAQIDPQRLVEMFEVMAELEAMCGRLAARRLSPDEETALKAAHAAAEGAVNAGDPDQYYYLNETFHQIICEASHNGFLAEQSATLRRRLRPYRRLQLRVRDRVRTSFSEHTGIIAAILEGDGDRAAALMRQHVTVQGERFADLIASLSQLRSA
jgi:DNA-binding GntR family transcriptional regulator